MPIIIYLTVAEYPGGPEHGKAHLRDESWVEEFTPLRASESIALFSFWGIF